MSESIKNILYGGQKSARIDMVKNADKKTEKSVEEKPKSTKKKTVEVGKKRKRSNAEKEREQEESERELSASESGDYDQLCEESGEEGSFKIKSKPEAEEARELK